MTQGAYIGIKGIVSLFLSKEFYSSPASRVILAYKLTTTIHHIKLNLGSMYFTRLCHWLKALTYDAVNPFFSKYVLCC